MIFKVEIDPFTKSGKKVYEYIESLKDKNGIRKNRKALHK